VIDLIDDALQKLVRRDALNGSDVEIAFDAPTKDWAARQNTPTVDVYLYDIREEPNLRHIGTGDVRNGNGIVTARVVPPRYFKLSYLVTAWTQRPEDEHRLLSSVLGCFVRYDVLPADVLDGFLADQKLPVGVTVGMPPPQDRSLSDVWSALGGELKPSLDLVVTAPVDTQRSLEAGPPVLEEPRITVVAPSGQKSRPRAKGRTHEPHTEATPPPEETVEGGRGAQRGRIIRVRNTALPPKQ
jgi:hypothetical protein